MSIFAKKERPEISTTSIPFISNSEFSSFSSTVGISMRSGFTLSSFLTMPFLSVMARISSSSKYHDARNFICPVSRIVDTKRSLAALDGPWHIVHNVIYAPMKVTTRNVTIQRHTFPTMLSALFFFLGALGAAAFFGSGFFSTGFLSALYASALSGCALAVFTPLSVSSMLTSISSISSFI